MRACIIGAGAAGICAAHHVAVMADWQPVVYEQSDQIGGVWVYAGDKYQPANHNAHSWNSAMYKNLKTNIPTLVMAFPDFPFPDSLPSFITHMEMREYLEDYAKHFNLFPFIKYGHEVVLVERRSNDNANGWSVTVKNLADGKVKKEIFDAIFVCSGHYNKPHIPIIPNSAKFGGLQMHSSTYRTPESFTKMRVACLGCGPSGEDISIDIATVAEKVYLCHDRPLIHSPVENLQQLPGIREFTETGIIVGDDSNGQEILVDCVIYCTGYEYSFPFMPTAHTGLSTDGFRIRPLYQHMINIDHPSMFLIGLPTKIVPFPLSCAQVQLAKRVLTGCVTLPSREDMLKWEEEDYEWRRDRLNLPHKKCHFLGDMQWDYLENLAKLGRFECPVAPVVRKVYNHVRDQRAKNLMGYRNIQYDTVDGENMIISNENDKS